MLTGTTMMLLWLVDSSDISTRVSQFRIHSLLLCDNQHYNSTEVDSNSRNSYYGKGEGPPLLILSCTGTESSIFDCFYNKNAPATSTHLCHEGNIAGIKCEGNDDNVTLLYHTQVLQE